MIIIIFIYLVSNDGTPLQIAFKNGFDNIVKFLIDNGANVNEYYKAGLTILQKACIDDKFDLIRSLVTHGANINSSYKDGITALHYATVYSPESVSILLDNHPNIDPKTSTGLTPLHLACAMKKFNTIRLLVDHGANVNQLTNVLIFIYLFNYFSYLFSLYFNSYFINNGESPLFICANIFVLIPENFTLKLVPSAPNYTLIDEIKKIIQFMVDHGATLQSDNETEIKKISKFINKNNQQKPVNIQPQQQVLVPKLSDAKSNINITVQKTENYASTDSAIKDFNVNEDSTTKIITEKSVSENDLKTFVTACKLGQLVTIIPMVKNGFDINQKIDVLFVCF